VFVFPEQVGVSNRADGSSVRVYEEHVTAIPSGLVEVERSSSPEQQREIIESVFREAHSLEGAARAVNLVKIEATCARHDMPAVLVNPVGFLLRLAF
jgi:chemotaxis protein histidine kinase CheA